jgi:uncharacterized protein (DUF1501 family)
MIDRRDFLKIAGAVIPSWGLIPIASAQSTLYTGPIYIGVHASGGIDASSWFDPRETDPTMNNYAGTPAPVSGNIRTAPMGNNPAFLARYFQQMLVLNGVNSETNSHDDGTRAHATGMLAMNYPNLSELFAYTHAKDKPMPWLNAGGMSTSVGLSPAVPMPDGNNFRTLLSPNSANATQDFIKAGDVQKVLATRAERLKAQQAAGNLIPRAQGVNAQFDGASSSRALLARVSEFLPATFDNAAHVGLVAAQAGISSTLQFSSGGFDGHGQLANSYNGANGSLTRLTNLVDYILTKAGELGIADRVTLRIYSEFGRTPLNNGNGKDHWPPGTQVIISGTPKPWGNRVVGATGPRHQQLRINPTTGEVDPVNGKVMTPRHVHSQLRKYLGIMTTDPKYALPVPAAEEFDIFNPNMKTGYPNL